MYILGGSEAYTQRVRLEIDRLCAEARAACGTRITESAERNREGLARLVSHRFSISPSLSFHFPLIFFSLFCPTVLHSFVLFEVTMLCRADFSPYFMLGTHFRAKMLRSFSTFFFILKSPCINLPYQENIIHSHIFV